jgi:hypothetical protein
MRSCDGCTKCCEGWVSAKIKGKAMYPGKPCHFVSLCKGCTIYEDRPVDPCVDYSCLWKLDMEVPAWLKPSESNVLLSPKVLKSGIEYIHVTEAGAPLQANVLSWVMIELFLNRNKNVVYQVQSGLNYVGSNEFVKEYGEMMAGK